jgi:hypothetical protein
VGCFISNTSTVRTASIIIRSLSSFLQVFSFQENEIAWRSGRSLGVEQQEKREKRNTRNLWCGYITRVTQLWENWVTGILLMYRYHVYKAGCWWLDAQARIFFSTCSIQVLYPVPVLYVYIVRSQSHWIRWWREMKEERKSSVRNEKDFFFPRTGITI